MLSMKFDVNYTNFSSILELASPRKLAPAVTDYINKSYFIEELSTCYT